MQVRDIFTAFSSVNIFGFSVKYPGDPDVKTRVADPHSFHPDPDPAF
jgi:hypothetical protein